MIVRDGLPARASRARPGSMMQLNAFTPAGLFEANNGDRFIVSDDLDAMIAIVLRHRTLPTYTWMTLGIRSAAAGRWWGPYKIVLDDRQEFMNSLAWPGIISRVDGTAGITCLRGDENRSLMPLGLVGSYLEAAESECWRIKPRLVDFVFCGQAWPGSNFYEDAP